MPTKLKSEQTPNEMGSGEQFVLTLETPNGLLHAAIAARGASLREFRLGDIELVEPYAAESEAPHCAGQVKATWAVSYTHLTLPTKRTGGTLVVLGSLKNQAKVNK